MTRGSGRHWVDYHMDIGKRRQDHRSGGNLGIRTIDRCTTERLADIGTVPLLRTLIVPCDRWNETGDGIDGAATAATEHRPPFLDLVPGGVTVGSRPASIDRLGDVPDGGIITGDTGERTCEAGLDQQSHLDEVRPSSP